MAYRDSASFGKRQEYVAVAQLLKRGHDVYMTLVDDQQIDCVVRIEGEKRPTYIDVQIKARSNRCNPRNAGRFSAMDTRQPRKNFIFIFYSEQADTYWVIPSLELIQEANQNKTGQNAGRYSINLTNYSTAKQTVNCRPRFDKYKNNFDLLRPGSRSRT